MNTRVLVRFQRFYGALAMVMAWPSLALAQAPAQSSSGMCPGCSGGMDMGAGMWVGMGLLWLLIVAAIAALVALAVFLVRRSGPRGPRHA